jgi:hypothetical protein
VTLFHTIFTNEFFQVKVSVPILVGCVLAAPVRVISARGVVDGRRRIDKPGNTARLAAEVPAHRKNERIYTAPSGPQLGGVLVFFEHMSIFPNSNEISKMDISLWSGFTLLHYPVGRVTFAHDSK